MKSPFQLGVLVAFGVLGVIGVAIFALQSAGQAAQDVGDVAMWGTQPAEYVNVVLHELGATNAQINAVTYSEHKPENLYTDYLSAIASGTSPDLIMLDDASVISLRPTLTPIPFTELSMAAFQNTFIDAAQVFLGKEGSWAVPVAADPLVLFWNKRLLAEHGYAEPPQYWAQIVDYAQNITVRDENGAITTSTVALGEVSNIANAVRIINAMILQAGAEVIITRPDGTLDVVLAKNASGSERDGQTNALSPAQAAVRAFTEFSKPDKRWYTWNKALKNSLDMFSAGDLALCIGRASDARLIVAQNPNLVFGIAPLPRIRGGEGSRVVTTGALFGLALPKSAKNPQGAYTVARTLAGADAAKMWEALAGLPPAQRALLVPDPKDAAKSVVRTATVQMATFPIPDVAAMYDIYKRMIDRINSQAERISESLQRADAELKILVRDKGLGNN